jgi:hypothetical protein
MARPMDKITMKFDLDAKEAIAQVKVLKATVEAIERKLDRIAKKAIAIKTRLS